MKQTKMGRYWINQPSKLQPCHSLHGRNVIAPTDLPLNDFVDVYFITGAEISGRLHSSVLSPRFSFSLFK